MVSTSLASAINAQLRLSAYVSDSLVINGQFFNIALLVEDETDFYAAAAEIVFDNEVLEFISVNCAGLTRGGINISGPLRPPVTGVSVSRTQPLLSAEADTIMVVAFRVKDYAVSGRTDIIFSGLNIIDSSGRTLPFESTLSVTIDVKINITGIRLDIPAFNSITEGEMFDVEAVLFVAGLDNSERLICQVGINEIDSDPAIWDGPDWQDMLFVSLDEQGHFRYTGQIGFMMPPGEWFIAVRAALDGGDYIYGGLEGEWSADESPSARLNINQRAPYRYTIASWDFNGKSLFASDGTLENSESEIIIEGARIGGFQAGADGLAANSSGWDKGADGSKFWMANIFRAGFVSVELSSRQYGSGTGPRDFAVQFSTDGHGWETALESDIVVSSNWTSGYLDRLNLPNMNGGTDSLFIRWIMISDTAVSGGSVGQSGTNRIDDIIITGINPEPAIIIVHPGDTNNDGIVNADDVLPLGIYWSRSGPPSVWEYSGFIPRLTEKWMSYGATYADANGDGTVDHRDLMVVGLNFGMETVSSKKESIPPLSTIFIDPMEGDIERNITITGKTDIPVHGVSYSVRVDGIPSERWRISNFYQAFAEDVEDDEIISFGITVDNTFESAMAMKGMREGFMAEMLAGFDLVVDDDWKDIFSVSLIRLSVSSGDSVFTSKGYGDLRLSGILSSAHDNQKNPEKRAFIYQNYPNPFIYETTIPLAINFGTVVKVEITGVCGTILDIPFYGFLDAGMHYIRFDGNQFPPGFYICRLTTSCGHSEIIRMAKTGDIR